MARQPGHPPCLHQFFKRIVSSFIIANLAFGVPLSAIAVEINRPPTIHSDGIRVSGIRLNEEIPRGIVMPDATDERSSQEIRERTSELGSSFIEGSELVAPTDPATPMSDEIPDNSASVFSAHNRPVENDAKTPLGDLRNAGQQTKRRAASGAAVSDLSVGDPVFDGTEVAVGKALFLGDPAAATPDNINALLNEGRKALEAGHRRREAGRPAPPRIKAFEPDRSEHNRRNRGYRNQKFPPKASPPNTPWLTLVVFDDNRPIPPRRLMSTIQMHYAHFHQASLANRLEKETIKPLSVLFERLAAIKRNQPDILKDRRVTLLINLENPLAPVPMASMATEAGTLDLFAKGGKAKSGSASVTSRFALGDEDDDEDFLFSLRRKPKIAKPTSRPATINLMLTAAFADETGFPNLMRHESDNLQVGHFVQNATTDGAREALKGAVNRQQTLNDQVTARLGRVSANTRLSEADLVNLGILEDAKGKPNPLLFGDFSRASREAQGMLARVMGRLFQRPTEIQAMRGALQALIAENQKNERAKTHESTDAAAAAQELVDIDPLQYSELSGEEHEAESDSFSHFTSTYQPPNYLDRLLSAIREFEWARNHFYHLLVMRKLWLENEKDGRAEYWNRIVPAFRSALRDVGAGRFKPSRRVASLLSALEPLLNSDPNSEDFAARTGEVIKHLKVLRAGIRRELKSAMPFFHYFKDDKILDLLSFTSSFDPIKRTSEHYEAIALLGYLAREAVYIAEILPEEFGPGPGWRKIIERRLSHPEIRAIRRRWVNAAIEDNALHWGRRGFKENKRRTRMFPDFWDLEPPPSPPRDPARWDVPHHSRHDYLRQFPAGMMQSPLGEIEFYARIAWAVTRQPVCVFAEIPAELGVIALEQFANPLLNNIKGAIPTTVQLNPSSNALLLSGPNMGGKTMTARGLATAIAMNQMSLPLPAATATLSLFRNIYTLFPKPEQLQAGYGYYGSLISQLARFVRQVHAGDLVILDEVPTGTDYYDLVAVTVALYEDLIKSGATVVATGHLKKAFEILAETVGAQPYQLTMAEQPDGTFRPDFHLAPGVAERSYAIELTHRAGFPKEVTELAQSYYRAIMDGGTFDAALEFSPIQTKSAATERAVEETADEDEDEDAYPDKKESRSLRPEQYLNAPIDSPHMLTRVVGGIYRDEFFAIPDNSQHIAYSLFRIAEEDAVRRETFKDMNKSMENLSGQSSDDNTRAESRTDDDTSKSTRKLSIPAILDAPEERLRLTKVFMSHDEPFLKQITADIAAVLEAQKPPRRSWFSRQDDESDQKATMQRMANVKTALEKLNADAAPLAIESSLAETFTSMGEALMLIGEAQKRLEEEIERGDQDKPETDDAKENQPQLGLQKPWERAWNAAEDRIRGALDRLDLYSGIARANLHWNLQHPRFSDAPHTLVLEDSKPLFPTWWREGPFLRDGMPQSFKLDPEKPVFVVTGPNSSGKTVLTFNIWLPTLLANRGYYVSGDIETSHYDKAYAFFGGQNLASQGESYFMNILKKWSKMLSGVTPNSLVVLDELHGSDYFEMAAIQLAVLHYLRAIGCDVVFNTHIRDGLRIAAEKLGFDIWKTDITFDEATGKVTPHYTISPDTNLEAKSHGLEVAKQWLTEDQYHRAVQLRNALHPN